MVELLPPPTGKVTENFTGKEHDDEIALNYFGARYLDPMLGMWISVDQKRQFDSPYLYAGNGVNPVNGIDPDGTTDVMSVDGKNTIQGGLTHIDDGINSVLVKFANGTELSFLPPPEGSYFSLENLDKQKFDPNMQQNADAMVKDAAQYWPLDFWGWGTKGPFDFKNAYYFGAGNTVGALNRTIMTARDAGNAIWGGWTRHKYLNNVPQLILAVGGYTPTMIPLAAFCSTTEGQHLLMQGISNIVAPGMKEDAPSATMQSWGFYNYTPK